MGLHSKQLGGVKCSMPVALFVGLTWLRSRTRISLTLHAVRDMRDLWIRIALARPISWRLSVRL